MALRSMVHSIRLQSSNNLEDPLYQFFTPDVQAQGPPVTLATKTLVVPIVSAANVPQLAVDILIASLSLYRLGTIDCQYLVPVVGGREGAQDGVTTPIELFGNEGLDIVVIQQRSPVLKLWKRKFISSLMQFAQESRFKSLLFMSGLDLTNRTDSQMFTPIYKLVPEASPSLHGSPLELLASIPSYKSVPTMEPKAPSFSGGGLTRRIFSSIPNQWTLPTGFLLIFALEGDNRADATLLSNTIAKILIKDGKQKEWREPESWSQGLFGPAHDQTMFG